MKDDVLEGWNAGNARDAKLAVDLQAAFEEMRQSVFVSQLANLLSQGRTQAAIALLDGPTMTKALAKLEGHLLSAFLKGHAIGKRSIKAKAKKRG